MLTILTGVLFFELIIRTIGQNLSILFSKGSMIDLSEYKNTDLSSERVKKEATYVLKLRLSEYSIRLLMEKNQAERMAIVNKIADIEALLNKLN